MKNLTLEQRVAKLERLVKNEGLFGSDQVKDVIDLVKDTSNYLANALDYVSGMKFLEKLEQCRLLVDDILERLISTHNKYSEKHESYHYTKEGIFSKFFTGSKKNSNRDKIMSLLFKARDSFKGINGHKGAIALLRKYVNSISSGEENDDYCEILSDMNKAYSTIDTLYNGLYTLPPHFSMLYAEDYTAVIREAGLLEEMNKLKLRVKEDELVTDGHLNLLKQAIKNLESEDKEIRLSKKNGENNPYRVYEISSLLSSAEKILEYYSDWMRKYNDLEEQVL